MMDENAAQVLAEEKETDCQNTGEAVCGEACMARELEALRALVSEQSLCIAELRQRLPEGVIEAVTPSEAADDAEDGFLWGLSR